MAKVLLVEDDNNLREIYEARMQAEGYDIITAKDGEEALVVAKANQPDLIISDVMMPKISGFEMLDILRNTQGLKEVKVIMLTALGQSDDQERADKLGADRYLVKSQVTLEDIVKSAHELLEDEDAAVEAAIPSDSIPAAALVQEPATPVAVATPPESPIEDTTEAPSLLTTAAAVVAAPILAVVDPQPVPASPAPDAAESVVSSNPVPEPVAAVPETAAAEPAPVAQPAEAPSAQSTAQEEAAVEAQIEDFIAGATPAVDAPAPVVAAPEPELAMPLPQPASEPVGPPSSASTADDKLITDAVDTFAANTAEVPEPTAAPVIAPTPVSETAAPVIANKKVISPTSPEEAKPDINQLLAAEEAKEIINQPAPVSVPTPGTVAPTVTPAPQASTDIADINNIAL